MKDTSIKTNGTRVGLDTPKETFIENTDAQEMSGTAAILAVVGALVVLIVYFAIIPLLGDRIDQAADIPAGSDWNSTENTGLVTGAELWEDNGGMISIAMIIIVVSVILLVLRGAF